jgi:hypothetical protein
MMADDADETEGRRLYRQRADALAMSQTAMSKRKVKMLDDEFAKITDADREYASDLCDDLGIEPDAENIRTVSEWSRKVRYEAVIADRKARDPGRPVPHHGSGPDNQ